MGEVADKVVISTHNITHKICIRDRYIVFLTGDGHLTAQNVAGEIDANRFISDEMCIRDSHIIYTMESFEQYPDIHYATLDFKKSIRLTHGLSLIHI